MVNLGKNIVSFRKKLKLTQNDLAQALFVTPQAISRWEKGITEPDVDTLNRMCSIFNTTIDCLVNDNESLIKQIEFERKIHRAYVITSIFMILLSIATILTVIFTNNLFATYILLGFAFLYLFFLIIGESSIVHRRNKIQKNNKKQEKIIKKSKGKK